MEATWNISCEKDEGTVDNSTVTRWFKKFCSGCKNLDDHTNSGKHKTMTSEALIQDIKGYWMNHTRRV